MQFEITLKGWDGNTDRTDHLVKWVWCRDEHQLRTYLSQSGLWAMVEDVAEIYPGCQLTFADGVDIVLAEAPAADDAFQVGDLWVHWMEAGNHPGEWMAESIAVQTIPTRITEDAASNQERILAETGGNVQIVPEDQ